MPISLLTTTIVERYVGISGAAEGNEMLPDGQFSAANEK